MKKRRFYVIRKQGDLFHRISKWLKDKEEADAEAADLAYERHLEEIWDK